MARAGRETKRIDCTITQDVVDTWGALAGGFVAGDRAVVVHADYLADLEDRDLDEETRYWITPAGRAALSELGEAPRYRVNCGDCGDSWFTNEEGGDGPYLCPPCQSAASVGGAAEPTR